MSNFEKTNEMLDKLLETIENDSSKLPDEEWYAYYNRVVKPKIDSLNKISDQFDINNLRKYLLLHYMNLYNQEKHS